MAAETDRTRPSGSPVRTRGWPAADDPRLPFAVLAGLLLGMAAGGLAAALLAPSARIDWQGVPVAAGTLVATAQAPPATLPPAPPEDRLRDRYAPPPDPLPALLEPGPWGALPRIAPDGRTPLATYARSDPPPPRGRPRLALVVRGIGLSRRATEAALALPAPIGLAFSPYAGALPALMRLARRWGHEVMLELPLDPGIAGIDQGPLAVAPRATDVRERLLRVLARGQGYGAVLVRAGAPLGAETLAPLLSDLGVRGLGAVLEPELGVRDAPLGRGTSSGVVPAVVVLDAEPDPAAVDFAFGRLEAAALRDGAAIALLDGVPLALQRLAQWLPSLAHKGFALVPPGRILQDDGEIP